MNIKLLWAKFLKKVLNPPALRNCKIDKTSRVCARSELNYVTMDRYSYVGNQCFLLNTSIGSFCSIADRCCIGGAGHPIDRVSSSPVFHSGNNVLKTNFACHPALKTPETVIENDVWLGMGCYIKSGVTIHTGAVVGTGSVVTKDIPPYEIWAGNPAKKIRDRFDDVTREKLLKSKWWDMSEEELKKYADLFNSPEEFLTNYEGEIK